MSSRKTQVYEQVMGTGEDATLFTQVYRNTLGQSNGHRRRFTQVYGNVMGRMPHNSGDPSQVDGNRVTQGWMNVMVPFTPNFEWIEMFVNEVFPYDISYNSIAATRFLTDVTFTDSGHDQRSSRWDQPLMEYDVAYGVRTMEHLHGLVAFFRAMRGRKNAFLYHDHLDHASTLAVEEEARKSPPIGWLDQKIGVADHKTHKFQLVKHYPTPAKTEMQTRPIYKPRPGSVVIGVNNQQVYNFEVDYSTGVITFFSNLQKVNMNGMAMQHVSGNQWQIVGPSGWTSGFVNGDKIITAGWINPLNYNSLTLDLVVASVSPTTLVFNAYDNYGEEESNVNGVSVVRHPAPRQGDVTAGYYFYVPVRFDTDRLPTSIEAYGIGGAAEVKLIEVRKPEFDL